jgi:carbonic anhydrase
MDTVETLTQRNAEFAAHRFAAGLQMTPSLKTIIIGCVDPRVDPAQILGIDLGDVAVIRNIGGRVTATTSNRGSVTLIEILLTFR